MTTEGHGRGRREDHKKKINPEMDLELKEIRSRMEQLALKMQQEAKVRWRYEWPLNRKVKWQVKKLLARGQRRLMRRWLRHGENLSEPEEELIHICELETGRNLSDEEDKGSGGDLTNYHEGRDEFSYFQVRNEMRSIDDLIECQDNNRGNSYFQVGNDMRLARDLRNYQVGRSGLSSC
jgi:hypothetical protein